VIIFDNHLEKYIKMISYALTLAMRYGIKWDYIRIKKRKKYIIWKIMAEFRFRGKYDHTIDDAGRINLPSRLKEVLRKYASEILVGLPWDNHLRIYPLVGWEELESRLLSGEHEQIVDCDKVVRYLESVIFECVLDKQGRLLVPAQLREDLGLKKDVVVIGMIDRMEVWSKEKWGIESSDGKECFVKQKLQLKEYGLF
jgi:MraZ protein